MRHRGQTSVFPGTLLPWMSPHPDAADLLRIDSAHLPALSLPFLIPANRQFSAWRFLQLPRCFLQTSPLSPQNQTTLPAVLPLLSFLPPKPQRSDMAPARISDSASL